MNNNIIGCFSAVIIAAILLVISHALSYFCGWLTGVILQWLIGDTVIYDMNYLFNTTRFTVDMLPTICGTLGVIGSFFKSSVSTSSNK